MRSLGQACDTVMAKARPWAVASRWRSRDGWKAAASSATPASAADVLGGGRAKGVGEEDGVAPAGAMAEDVAEPGFERGGARHRAVLDRPFEAVAVAVGADRKGRRQPGEEALQAAGGERRFRRRVECGAGSGAAGIAGARQARGLGFSHGRGCGRDDRARAHRGDGRESWPCPLAVGAGLGIEGRADRRHGSAEARDHRLDDVIAADAEPAVEELRREMTIAEVPGDADKVAGGPAR